MMFHRMKFGSVLLISLLCFTNGGQTVESSLDEATITKEGFEAEFENIDREVLEAMAERIRPRSIILTREDEADIMPDEVGKDEIDGPPPKQFFHLHHMKSGGTSLSSYISCGLGRLQSTMDKGYIRKYRLSECSSSSYHHCVDDPNATCGQQIEQASTMTYCAPLYITSKFGWDSADAVTMIRDPVDRVWSMFRFQTKSCFKCTNLTQIYKDIDEGNTDMYGGGVCLDQIQNHITRNMQSKPTEEYASDEERLEDAIQNLRTRFTLIGLLSNLDDTLEMFSYTFPWMASSIPESERTCEFPKANASPRNNYCKDDGNGHWSHWDLPDHPDEETRKVIEDHNQLDLKLYEVALEYFQVQWQAYNYLRDIE